RGAAPWATHSVGGLRPKAAPGDAPQMRDPRFGGATNPGPGSAAHRCALRRVPGARRGARLTHEQPPPLPPLVPESAPFSPEQRAWLNGFFAGMVSLDGAGVTALSPEQSAALMPRPPQQGAPDGDDDVAPWHDQTLAMAERMKLAEGRPLRRR